MTGAGLESYHYAWLADHPERTEAWLKRMMAEGFHIHHIDGDHDNNDHMNLVLIEGADHLMLHNGKKRPVAVLRRKASAKKPSIILRAANLKEARAAYRVPGKTKTEIRTEMLRAAVERANAPKTNEGA